MPAAADLLLVERIRAEDESAWEQLIARFEGRLTAFVDARLHDRAASEDVVQETLIGFLTSLPNYDDRRSLESWLFSIAAHKLTDHLRRVGRRPSLLMSAGASDTGGWEIAGSARPASSLARSGERRGLEADALAAVLSEIIDRWQSDGAWEKIACAELLFLRGLPNKEVAGRLGISEQQVANQKFDFISRLRSGIRRQGLSVDVFPELAAGEAQGR